MAKHVPEALVRTIPGAVHASDALGFTDDIIPHDLEVLVQVVGVPVLHVKARHWFHRHGRHWYEQRLQQVRVNIDDVIPTLNSSHSSGWTDGQTVVLSKG